MRPRLIAVALTALAIAWVAIVVAAPLALAHGYVVVPAIVYQAAALICHQRPERSFHLAGIQLPVCARCFGLYASGAVGAGLALAGAAASRPGHSRRDAAILAVAALPTMLTVAIEWAGMGHPGSMARAVAALPLGAAGGWLFVRALSADQPSLRRPAQVRYHA